MALEEEEESQNAPYCVVLDGLFCEEEKTEFDDEGGEQQVDLCCEEGVKKFPFLQLGLSDQDMFWDDDELSNLISKEAEEDLSRKKPSLYYDEILDDEFLVLCREKALDWIFKVKSHYGFNSLTALLAVNYFDRFITSRMFQSDKPWMSQLTAVACLSLAAKVEEIRVPLLLDFQVEEARYVFEAKTIQRMELLVLSTLEWRMHPVTPISYFDHIIRRYSFQSHQQLDFLTRCESLLLSIVPDSRFLSYSPSVLATAIMVSVIRDSKMCDEAVYQSQLMTLLKVNKEKVNKCYELVLDHSPSKKRMMNWIQQPASPVGVFDASFSSDSSKESWVVSASASVSSSPSQEPLLKRRRVQEQQMKVSSINRMFLDVLSSTSPR
ncbi:PREDICTED: cyclin-D3-3 isoform X1 [Camelina sativa]|uniref:Cyclin-D3-3 isoform X1 n=1 Tax=Camelina sativa TaxID=90675 RepID=A0ABM0THL8_CAMSA|nr:PREDICTED: cyclin-D3-3 isoform X1 [Camelina sativa]